jgi:transposase
VLTDARGVPIGVAIAGANVHDQRLVEETLASIPTRRPRPQRHRRQHLCADKGYDADAVRKTAHRRGYTPHIRSRGEEQRGCAKGTRARRWVVERTHSWINRARRLLVRWEKKAVNYLGFLHLQFAYTTLRAAGILG